MSIWAKICLFLKGKNVSITKKTLILILHKNRKPLEIVSKIGKLFEIVRETGK